MGLLSGCAGDPASSRLAAAREVWSAREPASYAFRISDAQTGGTTLVVQVRDGRADVRTSAGTPGPRTAVSDGGIDGLFTALRRALADGRDVAAQYDAEYGFPTDLLVRGEGGYELHVRGFVAG